MLYSMYSPIGDETFETEFSEASIESLASLEREENAIINSPSQHQTWGRDMSRRGE